MDVKRGVMLVFAILLVVINLANFWVITSLTGRATSTASGEVTLCIGKPATLTAPGNQTATAGNLFTLQLQAAFHGPNTSITYYDNTSLFAINQSGFISFTPASGSDGDYSILLTAEDSSSCPSLNATTTFLLQILPQVIITFTNPLAPTSDTTPELNASTNVNATCQYRNSTGSYAAMSLTGNTSHSQTLSALVSGQEHTFFLQCNTTSGGTATSSLEFAITGTSAQQSNSTHINTTGNSTQTLALLSSMNLTLNVTRDLTSQPIMAAEFSSSPLTSSFAVGTSTTAVYRYFTISASDDMVSSINRVTLILSYEESLLSSLGITEANLVAYFYNESSASWSQELDYSLDTSANRLTFNTTHLSTFVLGTVTAAAEEAEEEAAASAAAGGGGGSAQASKEPAPSFALSEELIRASLKQSQTAEKRIIVTNDGEVRIDLEITPGLDVISVSPRKISLEPGQRAELLITLNPWKRALPEVYTGRIVLQAGVVRKFVALVLEVESQVILFDGKIELPDRLFRPGEQLKAMVSIVGILPEQVKVHYTVSDMEGKVFFAREELLSVEEQVSFVTAIPLPEDLPPGQYVLSLKMAYDGPAGSSFATSTELFTVQRRPSALAGLAAPVVERPAFALVIPFMLLLLLGIALGLFFLHRRISRSRHGLRVVTRRTVIRPVFKPSIRPVIKPSIIFRPFTFRRHTTVIKDNEAVRHKLLALREGYQEGYIKKDTYFSARDRLRRLLGK